MTHPHLIFAGMWPCTMVSENHKYWVTFDGMTMTWGLFDSRLCTFIIGIYHSFIISVWCVWLGRKTSIANCRLYILGNTVIFDETMFLLTLPFSWCNLCLDYLFVQVVHTAVCFIYSEYPFPLWHTSSLKPVKQSTMPWKRNI